nr:MAG: RNA-dependent RNA polymerase [Penicillium miczynskii RNA virus 1]
MSEASGKGDRDWQYELSPLRHRKVGGVRYIGGSKSLRYRYVMPKTENSTFFSSFLDDRARELTGIEGPDVDIVTSEFVPPSEGELFRHIEAFGSPGPDGSAVSDSTIAGLLKELRTIEGNVPKLTGWMEARNLSKIKVPSQTSPGLRWKKMGYRSKKEALMPALREATMILQRMRNGGESYSVPPCGVAGRGKRMSMDRTSGAKKEGRLIVMPDLVHHLLGTMASGAVLGQSRTLDKSNGGITLGMGPFSDNYQQLADWCHGAKSFFFLDFKGFDGRVPARILRKVILDHVRHKFEKEPGSDAYWSAQVENLVRTKICMPDGNVYQKRRGVASGDPWTSIAGSYANWIMLKWACNVMGLVTKIWTFGDDSIVAVYNREVDKSDLRTLTGTLWDGFGMEVSPDKSYTSKVLVDVEEDPAPKQSGSFLSMYFLATPMGVRPTRGIQDMYELMLVPERNRGTIGWEVVRTSMAFMVFYYNDKARYVLEEYWDWLHATYKIPQLTGTTADLSMLREMDIPWSSFKWEWLNRLPRYGEVELMYKYGHTGFYAPIQWGVLYSKSDSDPLGNNLSFPDDHG